MIRNLLLIPAYFTIGYLAIIVCETVSLIDIFINKKLK
jgi:hypothetical protein